MDKESKKFILFVLIFIGSAIIFKNHLTEIRTGQWISDWMNITSMVAVIGIGIYSFIKVIKGTK